MRCLYRNINATSNERPGTLLGDAGTSNPGERRVIGHFKLRSFQRIALLRYKRLSVVGGHLRHAERVETIPRSTGDRKALRIRPRRWMPFTAHLKLDATRGDRVVTGIKPPAAIALWRLSPTFSDALFVDLLDPIERNDMMLPAGFGGAFVQRDLV